MEIKRHRGQPIHTPGLILLMMLLVTFLWPTVSVAEEKADRVKLTVQPGLSGLYKVGMPAGLEITINNQGQGFKGLLVIEPVNKRGQGSRAGMRFQKSVEIPRGSEITTNMTVSGDILNMETMVVLLVDGAPVTASPIQGTAVNGGLIALSLGEKPLRGGIAAWLDNTFAGQTTVKFLAPAHLPQDPLELGLADIIIVDDQALAGLTQSQIKLLKDWVYLGGMMILSGGAGSQDNGPFSDISPVKAVEQKVVSADLGGLQLVRGNLVVTTGELIRGDVLTKVNGDVVVASHNLGKGRVVYSGVALESLTSESAAIWPLVFDTNLINLREAQSLKQINNDVLGNAASYLPQLKTPPVPQVILAWAVYIVVVGPGLYYVLKRHDRRDWMWWLIPACAVATTVVVYLLSPAQRINAPISQTLAVVDIMDQDTAWVNATAAFVSPYGGTLNVQGAKGAMVWPSNNYANNQKAPVIHYDDKSAPRLSYPDVEYWSMRLARASAIKKDLGSIGGKLIFDDGFIKGKLENRSKLDLRDCRIVLGDRTLTIDKIPAGGTVEINQSLDQWRASLGPNDFRNEMVPPQIPGERDLYLRERQMLDSVLHSSIYGTEHSTALFLGWSDNSLGMFKILSDRQDVRDYNLLLMKQELEVELPPGKIVQLPPGMLQAKMVDSKGAYEQNPLGYTLFEGKLTLAVNLNRPFGDKSYRVVDMEFSPQQSGNLTVKIYDWQQTKWVEIPSAGQKIESDELQRFHSPFGECRILVEKNTGAGKTDRIILPAISVEGGMNP
ncbi:hypothetical protein [Desulforamulus ruminis]|uniref:Uncharacterized protein n=1 Tax=Desulforamulus ruminis (strain ATCC 23193 / DSM 2154 / NCIMB 8452 / DL) TaxID=696281 RepID=F6DQJ5_DESRL|nr:hypothetical protein [Desulforamulus ruminis]AEG60889.1 hypothetical protein Desru_2663 [Desulforamulus ruminis DSM 2154]